MKKKLKAAKTKVTINLPEFIEKRIKLEADLLNLTVSEYLYLVVAYLGSVPKLGVWHFPDGAYTIPGKKDVHKKIGSRYVNRGPNLSAMYQCVVNCAIPLWEEEEGHSDNIGAGTGTAEKLNAESTTSVSVTPQMETLAEVVDKL